MSYSKAMKHRPHRLNVGHTFNPGGGTYTVPKHGRSCPKRAERDYRCYRNSLAQTVRAARVRGASNAEIRRWLATH